MKIIEENCDYYIPALGLFIWKFDSLNRPNYKEWHIGRKWGDSLFAIRTPWFMWYLE